MFSGWTSSKSRETAAPSDDWDETEESYSTPLPPTMPVVKETIDSLVSLAIKQRMFIVGHADRVKIELVKEQIDPSVAIGEWYLNGFSLSDEDAVDFVRQCPDALSNLTYVSFGDSTALWTRITSWLRFGAKDEVKALNVVDDLAFVLTVAETIEVAGHVLGVVSYAMNEQMPTSGEALRRELAFELSQSAHRGRTHSMYLMATVVHSSQRVASGRKANTLKLDLSLYIYEPLLLGGLSGVAVNVSGSRVDDVPSADVDQFELQSILSKKGTFVASSVSDFILDSSLDISSSRAAMITSVSTDKLTTVANKALVSFFANEAAGLEVGRARRRKERAVKEAEEREEIRIEKMRQLDEEREKARREAEISGFESERGGQYQNSSYIEDTRNLYG